MVFSIPSVRDTLGRMEDPGFSDLGSRFVLFYFDATELG